MARFQTIPALHALTLFLVLLFPFGIYVQGQPGSERVQSLLGQIEQNNPDLNAFRSYMESQSVALGAEKTLPDLQAIGYYLPFGEHNTPDYWEYEVTQRFDFPTAMASKAKLVEAKRERLQIAFQEKRQAVLLKALQLVMDHTLLEQKLAEAERFNSRLEQAYNQLDADTTVSLRTKQKSEILWLDARFSLEELKGKQMQIREQLTALNGGAELNPEGLGYPSLRPPVKPEQLWQQREAADPKLNLLTQKHSIAKQSVSVARNQNLPDVTVGWNYQGIPNSNYSGFFAGLSIPLWSAGKRVEQARAEVSTTSREGTARRTELKSVMSEQVEQFQLLRTQFETYRNTLSEMETGANESDGPMEAFRSGELSFPAYHDELAFFHNARLRLLEMERELHRLQARIYRFEL